MGKTFEPDPDGHSVLDYGQESSDNIDFLLLDYEFKEPTFNLYPVLSNENSGAKTSDHSDRIDVHASLRSQYARLTAMDARVVAADIKTMLHPDDEDFEIEYETDSYFEKFVDNVVELGKFKKLTWAAKGAIKDIDVYVTSIGKVMPFTPKYMKLERSLARRRQLLADCRRYGMALRDNAFAAIDIAENIRSRAADKIRNEIFYEVTVPADDEEKAIAANVDAVLEDITSSLKGIPRRYEAQPAQTKELESAWGPGTKVVDWIPKEEVAAAEAPIIDKFSIVCARLNEFADRDNVYALRKYRRPGDDFLAAVRNFLLKSDCSEPLKVDLLMMTEDVLAGENSIVKKGLDRFDLFDFNAIYKVPDRKDKMSEGRRGTKSFSVLMTFNKRDALSVRRFVDGGGVLMRAVDASSINDTHRSDIARN